jgi:hypothetical protein
MKMMPNHALEHYADPRRVSEIQRHVGGLPPALRRRELTGNRRLNMDKKENAIASGAKQSYVPQ